MRKYIKYIFIICLTVFCYAGILSLVNKYAKQDSIDTDQETHIIDSNQHSDGLFLEDGSWIFYLDGKKNVTYSGLCRYGNELLYLNKGQIDLKFNGVVYYEGLPHLVKYGKVTFKDSGLGKYKETLHYFTNNIKDTSFTGQAYYEGDLYNVIGGIGKEKVESPSYHKILFNVSDYLRNANMSLFSLNFIAMLIMLVILYYTLFKKYQWIILLLFSFVFYCAIGGFSTFPYLIPVVLLSYSSACLMEKMRDNEKKDNKKHIRLVLGISIFLELAILWLVKYYNFTASLINELLIYFNSSSILLYQTMILPIGVSFYIFQSIGYMIDVSKNKVPVQKNIFKYALFVSFFPQLIQGPISRYGQLANQLYSKHQFDYERIKFGIQRMLWGYIKKMVIADRIAIVVNEVFNNYALKGYEGLTIFFIVVLYGFQIYSDFSGGIDVVLGCAEILDINMIENFRQPFFASSVSEFWQRWHISLGDWMREYVFYPLALSKSFTKLGKRMRKVFGNNVGKVIAPSIASFIVFLLVGLWHGAAWKYVVYGLYQSIFVSSASLFEKQYNEIKQDFKINESALSFKVFQILRTNVLISFGRYFSRSKTLEEALCLVGKTFSIYNPWIFLDGTLYNLGLDEKNFRLMIISIIILIIVEYIKEKGIRIRETIARQGIITRWLIYALAFYALVIFGMYGSGFDQSGLIYQGF